MAKVVITKSLRDQIEKKFKSESVDIFSLLLTFEQNPAKGKIVGRVQKAIIKEAKYKKFRFYCIADGHMLKFGTEAELEGLLIRFVRMSDKKDQQHIIAEIIRILKSMGVDGL